MNMLAREPLAAAVTLHATVLMAEGNENPSRADVAERAGLRVEVIIA